MALKFFKLKVAKVKQETHDAVSISFELPEDLKESFQYKPGQYLTVKINVDGQEFRRAYSLSSSPVMDELLTITTKRVDKGIVSNYLNDHIKPGDFLEVMPPMGNFVPDIDPNRQRTYIFFSGGSGITPVFSIMKSVLELEPHSKILLFYGNRNAESIIFHQELMELRERYPDRVETIHSLDEYSATWEGYKGRMDRDKANYLLNKYARGVAAHAEYFLCGPSGMMREVELALQDKLIPKSKIHKENFTSSLNLEEDTATQSAGAGGAAAEAAETSPAGELNFPVKAKIILDGRETEIEIKEDETVLEAAIDADLDPPFACQIGACSTCRAKLREGKVSMDEREALTDEEMDEGYILTCQSRPTAAPLVIDYDG